VPADTIAASPDTAQIHGGTIQHHLQIHPLPARESASVLVVGLKHAYHVGIVPVCPHNIIIIPKKRALRGEVIGEVQTTPVKKPREQQDAYY
jgi:hypothetical protein